jgi:ubiquinone/menaquinone biosynthesis C-methylase UbiE
MRKRAISLGLPSGWQQHLVNSRRESIVRHFLELMPSEGGDICLDIGGPTAVITEALQPRFRLYLAVNTDTDAIYSINRAGRIPAVLIIGDGCRLPLPDKSVDYVICHAVIEHVPRSRRQEFAAEIARVSKKGFFVSTNNYWFPYEPHYRMPFFQYVPMAVKRRLLNHYTIGWVNKDNYESVSLLKAKELRRLFPGVLIGRSGKIPLLSEHIFAYKVCL